MKITITLNYRNSSLEDKLIIWRMVQEVFSLKPDNWDMTVSSDFPQEVLSIELKFERGFYSFAKGKLFKLGRKYIELCYLLSAPIKIKTSNDTISLSIDSINQTVCGYFNVPVEMFFSNTRKREIVQARQIAMFFSKTLTKASLATIGLHTGDKDHATVLHAFKTVNNLAETDKKYRGQLKEVERRIKLLA